MFTKGNIYITKPDKPTRPTKHIKPDKMEKTWAAVAAKAPKPERKAPKPEHKAPKPERKEPNLTSNISCACVKGKYILVDEEGKPLPGLNRIRHLNKPFGACECEPCSSCGKMMDWLVPEEHICRS